MLSKQPIAPTCKAPTGKQQPGNERGRLVGRQGIDHHLPNHDQTITTKAMTSAILTKTRSTLRSLSRLSSLRSRGSGRFVGITGSPLRLITRTAYRTSSGYARQSGSPASVAPASETADDPTAGVDQMRGRKPRGHPTPGDNLAAGNGHGDVL